MGRRGLNGYTYHPYVRRSPAQRTEKRCVAKTEHPAVSGYQPVAAAIAGGGNTHYRLVEWLVPIDP